MKNGKLLNNSVIVAAHPDDEILWFSSLLKRIDHIVLCYLGELVNAEFGEFRKKALSRFPLDKKISCLGVVGLGIWRPRNFVPPKFSQYGIELVTKNGLPENGKQHYENNYFILREKLADILCGYQNVITHNPWGEYGHEEHVQVYRVVKGLQADLGFNLWTSNYCSTRTIGLVDSISNACQFVTLPTNPELAHTIMEVYKKTQCWTWYENWQWAAEETFFMEALPGSSVIPPGSLTSLNLILLPPIPSQQLRPESKMSRIKKIIGLGK